MAKKKTPSSDVKAYRYTYTRLRTICEALRTGEGRTRAELGQIVDRHPRTIQRDLDTLRVEFDAPIVFDRTAGQYRLSDPAWRLPDVTMTEGELLGYFAAEHLIQSLGATKEAELVRGALRKLTPLLPEQVIVNLDAAAEAIRFAPSLGLQASPRTLERLTRAAVRRRTVQIEYDSVHSGKITFRNVDPLLIYNWQGEFYAACFDHRRLKTLTFHIGRILSMSDTGRTFEIPVDWDREAYIRKGFGMYQGGVEVRVEVIFTPYQARYVKERCIHETEKRRDLPDGRLHVAFTVTEAALEQVARWALQYGEHVEVLKPKALRDFMKEKLGRARVLYETENYDNTAATDN